MNYVYSTLSADQEYAIYPANMDSKQIPAAKQSITINGKANVINPKTLIPPRRVVTSVSDDELKVLHQIDAFKRHVKAHYLSVEKVQTEPDEVANDMTPKDGGAQLTAEDFEEDKAPVTNG